VEFCCADSNSDYSSLRDTLYRNGQSFLFCFAVDDRTSFEDLEEIAQNVKRTKDGETYGALLVALRSDLQHVVKEEEMKSFVEKHGFGGYVITSSKTNTNVAEAFNRSIELAIKTTVPVEIVELVAQGKSITNTKHKKCVLC
jgi:GTPase KRas protein